MAETIVLFPKYTTLVQGTYYSDPFDVTPYKTISIEMAVAAGIDVPVTAVGTVQESSDLQTWSAVGSTLTPATGGASDNDDYQNTGRYIRLMVVVDGNADVGVVTMWAKAVARES